MSPLRTLLSQTKIVPAMESILVLSLRSTGIQRSHGQTDLLKHGTIIYLVSDDLIDHDSGAKMSIRDTIIVLPST